MDEFVLLFKCESEADELLLLLILQHEREMEANPIDKATHKHILEALKELDMATMMRHSASLFYFGYNE
jgi:hypothetical protein